MFWKIFRFGVVGVTTAVLYYGLLYAAVEWLKLYAPLASSLVYLIVIGFNYLMHYNWTFTVTATHTTA
ncbi:MAG: GtrA family protein, partial [Halioglobus sp.]